MRILFVPPRARVLASFALLAVFASLVAYAQLGGASGVVLPYVGHLEKDGVALDSLGAPVRFRFTIWNAPSGGAPCGGQHVEEAPVAEGRFAVEIGPVNESCVVAREVYLSVEVDEGAGTFAPLQGRQRVVPALASSTSGTGDFHVSADLLVDGDGYASRLRLTGAGDATATNPESGLLRIGPATGTHLALDNDEIMARANGTAAELFLNYDGGNIRLGSPSSSTIVSGTLSGNNVLASDVVTNYLSVSGLAFGFARGGGSRLCSANSGTLYECKAWGTGRCVSSSCVGSPSCDKGTLWLGHLTSCYNPNTDSFSGSCQSWVCLEQ